MNISSLIVTYNRLDKLKKTVEATLALPFKFVVIVDNGSTDGTAEWLNNIINERLIVLSSTVNTGGAGGFKLGAEWIVKNLDTDWVLFYDDDAYPNDDFFSRIKAEELNNNTVYACNIVDTSGVRCKMNIPWKKHPHGFRENIEYQLDPNRYIPDATKNESVVSVSFVGMIISLDILADSTKYIYDELFIYFDDVYFGHHLRLNNVPIIFLSRVVVVHDVNSRSTHIPPWKVYYLIRNMIYSKALFGNGSPFDWMYITLRLIKYTLLTFRHPESINYIKKIIGGVRDGIYKHKAGR